MAWRAMTPADWADMAIRDACRALHSRLSDMGAADPDAVIRAALARANEVADCDVKPPPISHH